MRKSKSVNGGGGEALEQPQAAGPLGRYQRCWILEQFSFHWEPAGLQALSQTSDLSELLCSMQYFESLQASLGYSIT